MKTQLIQNIRSLTLMAALSASLFVSCEDTEYPDAQPATTSFVTTARALIVNASNATSITAFIENVATGSALTPGSTTTYLPIPVSAANQVRIKGAGGTLGTTDLAAKSLFAANTSYTIFVTDSIARPRIVNATTGALTDAGGIRLLQVADNLTAPAAGNAHVRFFHLAPDPSTVVSVRLQPTAPTSSTVSPTFVNRAYRAATITVGTGTTAVTTNYANFTPVAAGTYTAQVYAGATIPTSATVSPIVSVSGVTLTDGKIYTIYARGLRRAGTLGAGVIIHN